MTPVVEVHTINGRLLTWPADVPAPAHGDLITWDDEHYQVIRRAWDISDTPMRLDIWLQTLPPPGTPGSWSPP